MTYEQYGARKYIPELDGARGFGVLTVVAWHMHDKVWEWLGGTNSVGAFFVLSGYLITWLALREEGKRGALSLKAFYIRRACRILPLYYLVLAGYCVIFFVVGYAPDRRAAFADALPAYLLYLQEIPSMYSVHVEGHTRPFHQSWSLGVEEKFYLLYPLVVFYLMRGLWVGRVVGTAAGAFGLLLAPAVFPGELTYCLHPHGKILLGCLLALLLDDRKWFDRLRFLGRPAVAYATAAFFLAVQFTAPYWPGWPFPYAHELVHSVAAVLLLASVALTRTVVNAVLEWRPAVFLGQLSYGMYLVHTLCINAAQKVFPAGTGRVEVAVGAFVLAAGLSVAAAYALAVAFERPMIALGRRWSERVLHPGRVARPAAPSSGIPTVPHDAPGV